MWCFTLKTSQWHKVEQNGPRPAPRSGHSLTFCDNKIILFGGLLEVTKETEDLYQFDIQSKFWKIHKKTDHEVSQSRTDNQLTQNSYMGACEPTSSRGRGMSPIESHQRSQTQQ